MRRLGAVVGAVAAAAALLPAGGKLLSADVPLPEAWRHWRYSRAVILEPAQDSEGPERLASVRVPWEVLARSRPSLADLRVIDEEGREIPYILHSREGSARERARPASLGEISFAAGQFTQVVVDAGREGEFYNALRIETPAEEFLAWVELALSDDAVRWRTLAERLPVFRVRREGLEGQQTVRFAAMNARYLRLRIQDGETRFPITGVQLLFTETVAPERERLPVEFQAAAEPAAGTSEWLAETAAAWLPATELRFEAADPQFHRAVEMASSDDGRTWRSEGASEIYRFRRDDRSYERLGVAIEAGSRRWLRVRVRNGNDAPLSGVRLALYGAPRYAVFPPEPGRRYRLLYGHARATAPEYELRRLTAVEQVEAAVSASAGEEDLNTAYADPRPWTERHPWLLWAALAAAVAVLGRSALRALRKAA